MEQQINLEAKIININDDSLRVGIYPQPSNRFTLLIINTGDQIKNKSKNPYKFCLKCRLGEGEDALFLDKKEADNCTIEVPYGWFYNNPDTADKNIYCFTISTYKNTLLEKDGYLKVKLSNFTSQTKPGEAILTFSTDLLENYSRTLTLSKKESKASEPGIIYFISEPEAGTQNFPGDIVTLKWHTHKLEKLQLYKIVTGNKIPILDSESVYFKKEENSIEIPLQSVDVEFWLEGYNGSNCIKQNLPIKVLQSPWYGVKNTIGKEHPAYPEGGEANYDLEPTLLLNANDVQLYGIFRFNFQGAERALLFETQDPFGNWKFLPTSVREMVCYIPEGFSTSPGVYHDDKIWLVGGSQIDPDQCSNCVWCLDLTTKEWKNRTPEKKDYPHWKSRMGHAVLVFKDKIWVMGGRDEAGNPLNDVWTLDVSKEDNTWTELAEADWEPRCLFSTAVFEDKIWIYGGAAEPFSQILYDELWSATYDESRKSMKWENNQSGGPELGSSSIKPIASCMQRFKERLYLFIVYRIIGDISDTVGATAFHLDTSTSPTWTIIPTDKLQGWVGTTTSSCQLVAYKGRMLIARILSYETIKTVMKIYVPSLE